MANTNSAKKRIQIAERNRLQNKNYKSSVRTLMKRCFVACGTFAKDPADHATKMLAAMQANIRNVNDEIIECKAKNRVGKYKN